MKKKVLTRRYGQGLINALRDEPDYQKVRAELSETAALLRGPGALSVFLASPFHARSAKMRVVSEVLEKAGSDARVRNFIRLLLEKGRFELLPGVLDLLPELWNDRMGVVTVEVASAAPLSETQKGDLKAALESREGRPVSLSYRLDPELVGGLSIRKGNEIMDLSLRGRLARLQDLLAGD
ncbi:MAG: ATP synthase F1 subunit delta [Candidatus Aminicenantes bacterium]|nr:ATP synthase F1 subunit delta [Candidatus Aminicenantes bacterium]